MMWFRIFIVTLVVVGITSLGVGASDVWQGNTGGLLAQLIGSAEFVCPVGMTRVTNSLTFNCIDTYEVSPGPSCVFLATETADQSVSNAADTTCRTVSVHGVLPWRYVTRADASLACARSGKRLPTAAEWFLASQGTKPETCTTKQTTVALTGATPACVSVVGASDMIGNVWEWVSDDVIDAVYNGRTVPNAGTILQFDTGGVPTVTTDEATTTPNFGYFWSNSQGSFGMIRGGFYGSKQDSGSATIQAATSPTFAGAAIGFRCVN